MLNYRGFFTGIAMLFLVPSLLYSQTYVSGFFPKEKELTLAVGYTHKSYDRFYRGETLTDGNPANLGEISSSIIGIYGEYGINSWLSAMVSVPYISIKSGTGNPDPVHNENEQSGLQDLSLALKARVLEKVFEDNSKLSIGGATGLTFPVSSYEGNGILSIGNKATAFDGFAVIQYTTNFNFFAEAQTGFSLRNNSDFEIPNALLYSLKIGYYNSWIYTHVKLGVQDSTSGYDIGSAEFGANGGPAALSQTEVDYTNLNFDVYVPIHKHNFGVSVGYGINLDGRNFYDENAFSIGLVYKN